MGMEKFYFGKGVVPNFFDELIDRCFGNPLSSDPDTSEWGSSQAGYGWFNTTEKLPKFWDGAQIQTLQTKLGTLVQNLEHHSATDTLTRAESGSIHTNLGAGTNIKLTLPQDAEAGDYFEFVVMTAQQLRIDPGGAGAIYINGAKQTDDKYIWADDEGESVKLVADGNGDWVAIGAVGTWSVEA